MPSSSAAINACFLGVIDPKPNCDGENECVLEKLINLRLLSTKPISLVRIAWSITNLSNSQQSFEERAPN